MKFSHKIQFTSVPDWTDYYLPYSNLKKLIYTIEKDQLASLQGDDEEHNPTEQTALINNNDVNNNDGNTHSGSTVIEEINCRFINALNKYLDKIVKFYAKKETEIYDEMDQLLFDFDRLNTPHDPITLASQPSEIGTSPPHGTSSSSLPATQGLNNWHSIQLKKRTIDLYVLLSELKSFVSLNHTGFFKILKKYDKITDNDLKLYYINTYVTTAFPFKSTTQERLNERIQETEHGYSLLATADNKESAIEELKSHLREHIVWERNTVWRDMVGLERKTQTVELVDDEKKLVWGPLTIRRVQLIHALFLVLSILVFTILLFVDIFGHIEQNRCFAILIFASLLWAGEVMPVFVTSLLVPLLIVTLRVMRSNDGEATRLDAPEAARRIFAAMFSPVIMILLSGFALAGALSKFGIAKSIVSFVLSKSGTRPNRVLLTNMLIATATSMWISNVATPTLCYSLIQPILRTLPKETRFAPCLIIGISLASNIGGMASPISSPQNIIAIQNMHLPPTWIEWFMVSVPLCLVANGIIWLWLIWNYAPEQQITHIHPIRASSPNQPITWAQIYISLVTMTTILVWCSASTLKGIFGDMGVMAILPLVAFFGPGLLTKDDFNNFLWNVVILAMGGIALGQAVESSGLLETMAQGIEHWVIGLSIFEVLAVFGLLVLILATFISHTVAALIVLPLVAEVGTHLGHSRLLVMGTAFICSCAMGLPVSGFPNMIAMAQENEFGTSYLSNKDFIRNGVPASVYSALCVTTLGYLLMKGIGF